MCSMLRYGGCTLKTALASASLLLLLWFMYSNLQTARSLQVARGLLEREKKRCLYHQGLDSSAHLEDNATFSQFSCGSSQYPVGLCSVSPLYLQEGERRFVVRVREQLVGKVGGELSGLLWPLTATNTGWPRCSQYFDEAYAFAVEGSPSDEWYFSLHVSTFLPLYSLLAMRRHLGPAPGPTYSVVLLPAVEDYSLSTIDWHTDAFQDHLKFSFLQQIMEAFAGSMKVIPLVASSMSKDATTCIRMAHFGVGTINTSDVTLLESFSQLMQLRLGLPAPSPDQPSEPFVCLAKRSSNRRILNEDGLLNAVSQFVKIQVVQFDTLSYREQVAQMQQFTVLVGFHGSELINSLYMPPGAVTIQLVPYGAQSLNTEKYARILRGHGPYLEWHNQHERNSRPNQMEDADNNLADTVVNVEEFVELLKQALKLGLNAKLVQFQGQ